MIKAKNYTLLYVEDDIQTRTGYLKYFASVFKEVYEASDGVEGYKKYKQHAPNIMIVDINMPKKDGLELIEEIRKNDKEIEIIILSAFMDETKLLRCITLGLTKYIKKPIKKVDLVNVLRESIANIEKNNKVDNIVHLSDDAYLDKTKLKLFIKKQEINLTKNESILLNVMTSNKYHYYSVDTILEEFLIVEFKYDITINSIRGILKRLKQKLPTGSIENTHGIGYKLNFIIK